MMVIVKRLKIITSSSPTAIKLTTVKPTTKNYNVIRNTISNKTTNETANKRGKQKGTAKTMLKKQHARRAVSLF